MTQTHAEINAQLNDLAERHGVRILYACESGSRAWGFPSPDSDWDIRFIYAHDRDWYLRVHEPRDGRVQNEEMRDVIEETIGDLDFSGFDLRKALRLGYKSNPSVLEWLHSPITYQTYGEFANDLRGALAGYSRSALMHHYVSLASRQYKAYWQPAGADQAIRLKKYLYAIRPLMAVLWMAQHRDGFPPIDFGALLQGVPDWAEPELTTDLETLLAAKSESTESLGVGRYPRWDAWILHQLDVCRVYALEEPDTGAINAERLDGLLREYCVGGSR